MLVTWGAARAFSPEWLFANGEQGWVYDPSNLSTLFQDAAGTTPVTAMEQPVGLQLDTRLGAPTTLGAELWSDSSVIVGTGWSAASGVYTHTAGLDTFQKNLGLVTGKTYLVTFTVSGRISGSVGPVYGGSVSGPTVNANGTYTQRVSSGVNALLYFQPSVDFVGSVSNISVRELPGNHRYQTTSANRPVVSARVNLLTKTEQFDDAAWNAATGNVTVSGNKIIPSATSGQHYVSQGSATSGVTHTIVVKAKQAGYTWLKLVAFNQYANFDLANGAVGTNFSGVSRSISAVGDGSYVCTFTFTSASSTGGQGCVIKVGTADNANWDSANFSGNGTDGIQLYYADLRVANIGVGLPAYQRVNTSTDYDTAGFPVYIKPNGSNQFMVTNSINFSATDKMTVWQGVRKLSDAAGAVLAEISADSNSNAGSFAIFAPAAASQNYSGRSRGSVAASAINTGSFPAPVSNVVSLIGDIAGDIATIRVNGTQAVTSSADQGTGNYGNYPAYFYMRAGTALPFGGHDYGSICRGAASTAGEITSAETWINQRTKAYA